MKTAIVWFRQDLRLIDNPALTAAAAYGSIIPLFIWAPDENGEWPLGGASKWWLHNSLESLGKDLKLIIRKGNPLDVIKQIVKETGAEAVFWNRRYEPYALHADSKVKNSLQDLGIQVETFNGRLLYEPWEIANKQQKPFQVFTPFWKSCLAKNQPEKPLPIPAFRLYSKTIFSEQLTDLQLLPNIPWDSGIKRRWNPGSEEAEKAAAEFIENGLENYAKNRDFPSLANGVSHLSPYLHFGEISVRSLWHKMNGMKNAEAFLRQLGWREFAYHLLYHFPTTPQESLKKQFDQFPWKYDKNALKSWQKGKTGYPFVDAGMRELWTTGWMHNRVRLVTGSFLVKDLQIHWLEGEKWFWDTLVDADLANNCLGWQWVAGCGADAAPYFRIFNPITQGEKFDPQGDYVRTWVPELANLPAKWIHRPWEAPSEILREAKVRLGIDYPYPIVDHAKAREEALEAFASIKSY